MENEELNLDELDKIETGADNKLQVRNRFQQLANDKRDLSQKLEVEAKAKTEAEAKLASFEKETNFYKTFNTLSAKYPEAVNFQDKILEKVNQGYDQEDATVAVLNKEGKLGGVAQPIAPIRQNAEGGSAITIGHSY